MMINASNNNDIMITNLIIPIIGDPGLGREPGGGRQGPPPGAQVLLLVLVVVVVVVEVVV